jgi:dihydrofolate synthase/folylpolyglutamate synthase
VYTAKQKPEAREVFERVARERECRLTALENRAEIEAGWNGPVYRADIRIDGEAPLPLDLAMPGAVQADNATLALLVLRDIIGPLSPSLVSAVGAASLPGRFELIEGDPPMILDVAHTPVSVAAVIDTYRRRFSASPVVIFGAVRGKRIEEMASLIRDLTADVVVTRPGTFKKSDPEAIAEHFRDHGHTVVFEEDADAALRAARSIATNNRPILVVGSFYLVGLIASRLEAQA